MAMYNRRESLPLPPANAKAYNTVCQYCTVGCGYKVYVWPKSEQGGLKSSDNAFGVDFTQPQPPLAGFSYTESMHSVIRKRDGLDYNIAIVPATDSPINLQGNHSSRGGINAKTTWSDSRPTRVRLHYPLLRQGDALNAITWDQAVELQALVIKGILDKYGPDQLTSKIYDHGGGGGGYENTYGTGRLLFTGLQMKYVGIHNRPGYSSETWGTRDRGLHELNYTAQDARLADTIVLWGANSYDTASVFYLEHMMPNMQGGTADEKKKHYDQGEPMAQAKVVIIDPRISSTVNVSRTTGAQVLHLRPKLGTDYMLANAVARVVWEKKLYNKEFLDRHTDMKTFEDYKTKSLELGTAYDDYMRRIEHITGVPQKDIEQAALWIAEPKQAGGKKYWNRSFILYEKGIIWNYRQYDAVAAVAQLGALTFSVGRPGTATGRQGGHQEGYARPAYPGPTPPPDVDKYLQSGQGKLFWATGCNPYLAAQNNALFRERIGMRARQLTDYLSRSKSEAGEPATTQELAARILEGLDKTGGLFVVVQNIYQVETAHDAHLILPAAQWGEMTLTSLNCNSRLLRIYERFMDPPGDARPDWEIHGMIGQKLEALYTKDGKADTAKRFSGMDWKDGADVLKAAELDLFAKVNTKVPASKAGHLDPEGFKGITYEYLRKVGQKGIQTPVREDPKSGELVGTARLYPTWNFNTPSGKFLWYGARPWDGFKEAKVVSAYLQGSNLKKYPFWLTNGRNQTGWQTMYHMRHLAEKTLETPLPYVEVNPADAKKIGVVDGDLVTIYNEQGNTNFAVKETDAVPQGTVFALMYHWLGTSNSLTSPYTDPKSTNPWYKGTRVGIQKISGSLPSVMATTSFLPTNKFD